MFKANNSSGLPPVFHCSPHRASGVVNNDIVVEMKTDKTNEEAGLLNKRPSPEKVRPVDTGVGGLRVVDPGFGPVSLRSSALMNVTPDATDRWHAGRVEDASAR